MKIIVYKQPDRSKSVQLSRALHGYTDRSNYRYTYEREGLLGKIPHQKILNGVFLLKNEDVDDFMRILERYNVTYYIGSLEYASVPVELH